MIYKYRAKLNCCCRLFPIPCDSLRLYGNRSIGRLPAIDAGSRRLSYDYMKTRFNNNGKNKVSLTELCYQQNGNYCISNLTVIASFYLAIQTENTVTCFHELSQFFISCLYLHHYFFISRRKSPPTENTFILDIRFLFSILVYDASRVTRWCNIERATILTFFECDAA